MRLETLREFCLSLPHCEEKLQWGEHLLFTIAGKMFCLSTLEPGGPSKISFKCSPESFAELTERAHVIPAPYLARSHWVALVEWDALPTSELKERLCESYRLMFAKLPRRIQTELAPVSTKALTSPARKKRGT